MSDTDSKLPCADKMTFNTAEEAEGAGLAAEWQHGGKLQAYRCQHCRLWHLSSQ